MLITTSSERKLNQIARTQPPYGPEDILVAAHSFDADNRPLSSYEYVLIRPVRILGVNRA
ncbi:hypothetical protein [Oscillibacter sp.]|uniref:hypothetical protein n=1 Tax=Oscillibacter sp. TaxID=1945593 RepID=UPI002897D4C2|nr:hypothetical protein [Oscillibacter sp.]